MERLGSAVQAGAGTSTVAKWRSRSASGQAAAKARRTRAAVSRIRAPSAELEQPEADRRELGPGEAMGRRDGVPHGEHQRTHPA